MKKIVVRQGHTNLAMVHMNGFLVKLFCQFFVIQGSRRKKRQLFFPPACSTSDKNTVQLCLDLYGPAGYYWLTKNMNRNSNNNYYYIIKCDKDNFGHKCSNHVQVYRYYCYKFYC